MSVGERDYTERVIATVRPASILGGRVIFQENFETIADHSFGGGSGFSTTADRGTVWAGERSGMLTMPLNTEKEYELRFPIPVLGFFSVEFIFQPTVATEAVQYVALEYELYDGLYYTVPKVRLRDTGNALILEVYNSTGTYETVATLAGTGFQASWHIFQVILNTATRTYVKAQFDNLVTTLTGTTYYEEAGTTPPYAGLKIKAKPKTGMTAKLYFDDILGAYEEI